MTAEVRTCRLCRKQDTTLLKYGTRQYAHTRCLVSVKGEAFILTLPPGTLGRVAIFQVSAATREKLLALVGR